MKKSIYVTDIVKDSKNNMEKYLFSENERLNAIIDELEDKIIELETKNDVLKSEISDLKADKKYYKENCERALNYIENHDIREDKTLRLFIFEKEELKEILRGANYE